MSAREYLSVADLENYQWRLENREWPFSLPLVARRLTIPAAIELASLLQSDPDLSMDRQLLGAFSACSTWRLLRRLNWPTCGPSLKIQDDGVAFISLPNTRSDPFWIRCLRGFEKALNANGFPIGLSRALTGALGELVDNVWQHSGTEVPGLIGYQVGRRCLTFGVTDTGMGILDSLRTSPKHRFLTTSMDALETAILPGVSRHEFGGYGFSTLFQAIAELWGITRLRTGEAVLLFDRQTEHRKRKRYYLPALRGFQVLVSCRLTPRS